MKYFPGRYNIKGMSRSTNGRIHLSSIRDSVGMCIISVYLYGSVNCRNRKVLK